jgi:hypothetical protein
MSARSGTEKRQRTHLVGVRFNDEEYAAVTARAEKWGVSVAEAVRWPAVDLNRVVHLCPPDGSTLMPCCNRSPFEVSRSDRMTLDRPSVTCRHGVLS